MSYLKGWRRVAGLAVAGLAAAVLAAPAEAEIRYGDVIHIHESVLVEDAGAVHPGRGEELTAG